MAKSRDMRSSGVPSKLTLKELASAIDSPTMKQRFSGLDVTAVITELQSVVGLRLANVYDINAKTYLFKFAKAEHKDFLLVESGIRIHTTEFVREKANTPSSFTMKLRKHLRTRRLTSITQVGMDRIVDMQFGEGSAANHIIVELYASGNIVLTDASYTIMNILRAFALDTTANEGGEGSGSVQPQAIKKHVGSSDENLTRFAVGQVYPLQLARQFEPMSQETLRSALVVTLPEPTADKDVKKGKSRKARDCSLKNVLRDAFGGVYGTVMVDHVLHRSGVNMDIKLAGKDARQLSSEEFTKLFEAFGDADAMMKLAQQTPCKGYIFLKQYGDWGHAAKGSIATADAEGSGTATELVTFSDFQPFLFDHLKDETKTPYQTHESFDRAVDKYYSTIESQKQAVKARQAEMNAQRKLESVKAGHENQLKGLEALRDESIFKAHAIESSLQLVDNIIYALRSFLATGMDWTDLQKLIADEKRKGNPLARLITGFKLDVAMITVSLPNPEFEDADDEDDTSDEETEKRQDAVPRELSVDIDIYASAYANARKYYDSKKVAEVKHEKTVQAAEQAIKNATQKIEQELAATQKVAPTIAKMRKPFWFERFLWFISSENYLVVGGRDASQNEQLVRRYLKKGDVYVHADLHGAASVIIKNPDPNGPPPVPTDDPTCPIPPITLHQAGTMSVCQSKAWDSKIVTSAWWVHPEQVSKTAPSGEYLTTGSFMIRGKKNWLPPIQLIYGYALLFKVADESVQRHLAERRPWLRGGDAPEPTPRQEASDRADTIERLSSDQEEQGEGSTKGTSDDDSASGTNNQEKVQAGPDGADSDSDDSMEFPDTEIRVPIATMSIANTVEPVGRVQHEQSQDQPAETQQDSQEQDKSQDGKKRLTAKQRRQLKKTGVATVDQLPDGTVDQLPDGDDATPQRSESQASLPDSDKGKGSSNVPQVRGKRGKMKKLKDKYAEQDEEERQIRLELLGSAKGPQPKGKRAKAQAAKAEARAAQQAEYEAKQQEAKARQPPKEKPAPVPEDNDDDEEEDLMPTFNYLDTLTGSPHAEDILLHAITVCGPWTALQRYKYKVKLLPGSVKRGKAAKSAIAAFSSAAQDREKELIKVIPDQEYMVTMLGGGVKVVSNLEGDDKKKRSKRS